MTAKMVSAFSIVMTFEPCDPIQYLSAASVVSAHPVLLRHQWDSCLYKPFTLREIRSFSSTQSNHKNRHIVVSPKALQTYPNMSTANQLDNLSNCLRDNATKSKKDIGRLKKAMGYVIKKMRKFEEASSLEKARAAKFRTKLRRAQTTRKNSKVRTIPMEIYDLLPAGHEPRRVRKRRAPEENITLTLCAIKDGKLIHHEDFAVEDVDVPECCQHIFTHGGACEHWTPAGREHTEIVKHL